MGCLPSFAEVPPRPFPGPLAQCSTLFASGAIFGHGVTGAHGRDAREWKWTRGILSVPGSSPPRALDSLGWLELPSHCKGRFQGLPALLGAGRTGN